MLHVNTTAVIINPVPRSSWTAPAKVRPIDFVAAAMEADLSPYMLGVLDAEKGEAACPEMYYVKRGDCCAYCEGYAEVAGPTLTTRQFLGEPERKIDFDAELAELRDGMADIDFWRHGC